MVLCAWRTGCSALTFRWECGTKRKSQPCNLSPFFSTKCAVLHSCKMSQKTQTHINTNMFTLLQAQVYTYKLHNTVAISNHRNLEIRSVKYDVSHVQIWTLGFKENLSEENECDFHIIISVAGCVECR